jgi:hypothetical protein
MHKKNTCKLNNIDSIYLAMEDVVSSQGQLFAIRFEEQHSADEIKLALRKMFSIYPRMRSVVEPTLFSYRLRALDDDDRFTELLFNDSFRVVKGMTIDSEDFFEYRKNYFNEPFALEFGFPVKMRYFPDNLKPLLLFSLHHIVCDGIGLIHLANSLITYLNGGSPPEVPFDNPTLVHAFIEKPFYKVPEQLIRSFRLLYKEARKPKAGAIVEASSRPVKFWGLADNHVHIVGINPSDVKTKSKELGVSITSLLMTALVMTLVKGKGPNAGNVIGIIMPIDIRPYYLNSGRKPVFGNFVVAPLISIKREIWNDPSAMARDINSQIRNSIKTLEQRNALAGFIIDKLFTVIGKKLLARSARMAKKRGIIAKTVAFSNLGNVDRINKNGNKTRICEIHSNITSHGLFIACCSLNNLIYFSIGYQTEEFQRQEIIEMMKEYDMNIKKLVIS